jgi:Guanine nucleotide exchange factor synembryn
LFFARKKVTRHFLVSHFINDRVAVARFVKYVGYGNAAGLLANRGLMLGGKGRSGHYSSDSEDSDTEEYKLIKDQ